MTSASVQAAVYVREKQKLRQNKRHLNRGRFDLPSHVATRDIAPFPTYPPQTWVSIHYIYSLTTFLRVYFLFRTCFCVDTLFRNLRAFSSPL